MLLCSGPVYEGISNVTRHSHSDRSLHVAIHFVVVLHIHIHTNGSTPILILYLRFFVAFTFVIHITDKWNQFVIHSGAFLTDHLHKSTTPYIGRFIWVPNYHPCNTIITIV